MHIHKFSHATMPIFNLYKNCSYYWAFAAFVSYFINHPKYTPPPVNVTVICLAMAYCCQVRLPVPLHTVDMQVARCCFTSFELQQPFMGLAGHRYNRCTPQQYASTGCGRLVVSYASLTCSASLALEGTVQKRQVCADRQPAVAHHPGQPAQEHQAGLSDTTRLAVQLRDVRKLHVRDLGLGPVCCRHAELACGNIRILWGCTDGAMGAGQAQTLEEDVRWQGG